MPTITVFDAEGNEYEMETDEDAGTPETRTPAEWAKLRRAEKAARDTKAEKEMADRMVAFYRAGISPDDPRMGYFVKGYDGDLHPDKIKEAAVAAGFLSEAGPTGPIDPTAENVDTAAHAANRAIGNAAAGAAPDQRTAVSALIEADAAGGRAGLIDHLRAQGIPVQFDSQE